MKISKPGSVPPNTQTSVALRILKREMPKCEERERENEDENNTNENQPNQ